MAFKDQKRLFVFGSYELLEMLEGKIREIPFFKVQSGKQTVCLLFSFLILDNFWLQNAIFIKMTKL